MARLMTRREWAGELCRRLSTHVAQETPRGLRHWEPAWELVEAPSRELLEALSIYEQTGSEAAKRRCIELTGAVLAAWRQAAAEWEHAGCPGAAAAVVAS
jgi:hypothetical protein